MRSAAGVGRLSVAELTPSPIRAARVGSDTTAGQIAHLVESAPMGDTRMQNHAELLADRLVAPTVGLAVGTAALSADFSRFLSLVIVDYGTGIRVAAPTSVLSSMTHAARAGIVIKSGGHMEKLAKVDTIVFDKTGTLTHGVPAVVAAFVPGAAVNGETTPEGARAGARFIVGLDNTPAQDAVWRDDSAENGGAALLQDKFFVGRALGGMLLAVGLWQALRIVEGQRRTVRPENQSGAA